MSKPRACDGVNVTILSEVQSSLGENEKAQPKKIAKIIVSSVCDGSQAAFTASEEIRPVVVDDNEVIHKVASARSIQGKVTWSTVPVVSVNETCKLQLET